MLDDVPDVIPAEHHPVLKKSGVENTAQLYEQVVSRTARSALAAKTGIDAKTLRSWARFLDLMQLSGIGPKMVRVLNASRVVTLRDLRAAEAADLHNRMRAANRGSRYSEVIPSVETVGEWINAAKRVTPRLE